MITKIQKLVRQSKFIKEVNNYPETKPTWNVMLDLIRWTITNRGFARNFFVLGLDQKGKNMSDYLNFRSFKPYYKEFYPPSYMCILEDKLVWEKFINNFPEYAPKNIGFVTKNHFYQMDAKPQPLENILKHPMRCIVKNTWGFAGKDIFLLTVEGGELFINSKKSSIEELKEKLPERAVIQELLEQHEDLKRLHPASINTSRIITVNTGSNVHIIATFLRVGANGNVVDNLARGNIYIPIDKETGKLTKICLKGMLL